MKNLLRRIRACQHCAAHLPYAPHPVVQADSEARILVIGQAPGARVHESGVPWQDASGRQLREWLGIDEATFYDAQRIALMPMGFCYPGKGKSGDLPPRPECAPLWHQELLNLLPHIRLTLLIGQYSQQYYLGHAAGATLTETVRNFHRHLPAYLVLPHPSPRNRIWMAKNPWFAEEVLPVLRQQVGAALEDD